ncbi:MAG: hypothetical protein R3D32_14550 [Nitratireductor sp.]
MAGKDIARTTVLARLSHEIARVEGRTPMADADALRAFRADEPAGFAIDPIDAALGPAGLERAALHEVRAAVALDSAAASGFALGLGMLLSGGQGRLFWISTANTRHECGAFFATGMAEFGLEPERLVRVQTSTTAEALWAAGEITATRGAGLCLLELAGNPAAADFTFSRRVALRAAASRTPVIILRQGGLEEASAAASRWLVRPALSQNLPPGAGAGSNRQWQGNPAFDLVLEKSRSGRSGRWIMEWKRNERIFALVGSGKRAIGTTVSPATQPAALSRPQPAIAGDRQDSPPALGHALAHRRAS